MSHLHRASKGETFGLEEGFDAGKNLQDEGGRHTHNHPTEEGSNDHLASIYECREDQFEVIVPFIREGLEKGERCLYIADENTEGEIRSVFREGGIDVDAALETGALSIHTKADTYLRTGRFEQDRMLDFWRETLAEARDEEGYAGVRATAEMTWALDDDTGMDRLLRYEAMLNTLFRGEEYVVLCQYNRNRFPDSVLSDVIRTHPLIVGDGTVCRNVHYHQPDEFFEADPPLLDVDRTVQGLIRRANTLKELRKRDKYQHELYRITSDPDRSFSEKLDALFELGCEYFDLEVGGLARIDPTTDLFEVEVVNGRYDGLAPGNQYPLSETYARLARNGGTAAVEDPVGRGLDDTLCFNRFDVRAYLGTHIEIDGDLDRVFFFLSDEAREKPFSESKHTFHHLMGQWVEYELKKKLREERLAGLNTLSRKVMQAETQHEICKTVIEAAESTLGLPVLAIALYDEQEGALKRTAATDLASKLLSDTSILDRGGGTCWIAFANGEPCREPVPREEAPPYTGPEIPASSISEIVVYPLGSRGVLITGAATSDDSDTSTCDVVETIVATTEAALDRANRVRVLHEREKDLKELTETLEERVEARTQQVRELTSRVTMAELRERRRIAQVLHDGLQQKLYGIQLQMISLRNGEQAHTKEQLLREIDGMEKQMEEVIQITRRLSVGMSPPVLRSEGLTAALEWLKSHMKKTRGLDVQLSTEGEFPMGEEMRVLLFQVTRELLSNVAEHAGVGQAVAQLCEKEGSLLIRVADKGDGFDDEKLERLRPEEGFGLMAARERIRLFGGDLKVSTAPGAGTEVTICMPLDAEKGCPSAS